MGKWYYLGEEGSEWKHLKSFQFIEEQHKHVHESGIAVLVETANQNLSGALEYLKAMEIASNDVLNLLTRMEFDIEKATSEQSLAIAEPDVGGSVTLY